jgi:hypothetical protein
MLIFCIKLLVMRRENKVVRHENTPIKRITYLCSVIQKKRI